MSFLDYFLMLVLSLCTDLTVVICLRQELDIDKKTKKGNKPKKKSKL